MMLITLITILSFLSNTETQLLTVTLTHTVNPNEVAKHLFNDKSQLCLGAIKSKIQSKLNTIRQLMFSFKPLTEDS